MNPGLFGVEDWLDSLSRVGVCWEEAGVLVEGLLGDEKLPVSPERVVGLDVSIRGGINPGDPGGKS